MQPFYQEMQEKYISFSEKDRKILVSYLKKRIASAITVWNSRPRL